ncbi:hypothetical protein NKR19_g9403 [Coniochaeta hoffmannii]|uniref:Uncharacterized protein n=1 Tax=Coniochaeta hoffmannii TaxID=91930 RepID=A0AA38RC03_9PEZI|nr:hypothetical protein NKR19_g9403 [Coniochaeta hoffmannii]
MSAPPDKWPSLRLDKEIRPLVRRYGIEPEDPKTKKAELIALLEKHGVPLNRVKPITSSTPINLKSVEILGLGQISKDFPPGDDTLFDASVLKKSSASKKRSDGDSNSTNNGPDTTSNTNDNSNSAGASSSTTNDNSNSAGASSSTTNDNSSSAGASSSTTNDNSSSAGASSSITNDNSNSAGNSSNDSSSNRRSYPGMLVDHKDHEQAAQKAGLGKCTELFEEYELHLVVDYPVAKECVPNILDANEKMNGKYWERMLDCIRWFGGRAKTAKLNVADAMVFMDHYVTGNSQHNLIDYLSNEDVRGTWYDQATDPKARRKAAERLSLLFDIALNPAVPTSVPSQDTKGVGQSAGASDWRNDHPSSGEAEFFMDIVDPSDGADTKVTVIGKHMSKSKVLAVRAESLTTQYPELGRGIWIECKQGRELEAYNKYVKGPNRKLESADVLFLENCTSPESFDIECVFIMKWGKTHHWYAYGRPKNDPTVPNMMFSRTTLSKAWKSTATTMRALERHLRRVGQGVPDVDTDTMEVITLRAPRKVVIKPEPDQYEEEL